MKRSIIKSKYLFSATTIIVVVLLWIILSKIVDNDFVFPSFKMILDGAKIVLIDHYQIIPFTIIKIVLGIVISGFIASLIVLLYILKKDLIGFFTPILSFIHVVPTMGITLYLFYFVKNNYIPFVLVVMVTVPIIVEGLITAYDNIDKGIMDVLKLEQISFFKKLFKVYIPLMMPYVLMTLFQSISLGIKALIMGEYLIKIEANATPTLGILLRAYDGSDSGVIIFILILLFGISIICEIIIKIIQAQINKYLVK